MSVWVDTSALSPHECKAVETVTAALPEVLEALSHLEPQICPRCGGEDWASDGTAQRRSGRVRVFRCTGCGKKITEGRQGLFRHPVFAREVMVTAVLLREAGWTQVRLAEVLRSNDSHDARRPNRQTVARWTRRLSPIITEAVLQSGPLLEAQHESDVLVESKNACAETLVLGGRFRVEQLILDESDRIVAFVADQWAESEPSVVIKVLPHGSKEELRSEFEIRARLRHPHLVPVLDVGDLHHLPGFAMEVPRGAWWFTQERVQGHDLYESARDATPAMICEWLVQSLRVLAWLHERGVIHRDVKPSNILVNDEGIQLVDFGIAIAKEDQAQGQYTVAGSPAYVAPELHTGGMPSQQSDLYSLGITFQHVVNRSLDAISVRTDMSTWFLRFLQRLANPAPEHRPDSAVEALDELSSHAGTIFSAETADTVSARLRAGWERVCEGHITAVDVEVDLGNHVFVTGPSGCGKTTVVHRWRHGYQLDGGILLPGTASNLLRAACTRLGTRHPLLSEHRQTIDRLLGSSDGVTIDVLRPSEAILSDRDTVLTLLDRAFPEACVVLADDIDALDPLSFGVMDALLHDGVPQLRVVGSLMEPSRGYTDTLRAWVDTGVVSVVELLPWTEQELAAALDEAFADEQVSKHLCHRVLQVTEGNPRFVEELLCALVDRGALRRDGGRWHVDHVESLPVPSELASACRYRVNSLQDNERHLLELLAYTEQAVPAAVFAQLAVIDTLDVLLDKGLVRDDGQGIMLAHPGVRDALNEPEEHERRAGAAILAKAIEAAMPQAQLPSELLGELWQRAGEPLKAYPYMLRAFRTVRQRWDIAGVVRLGRQLDALIDSNGAVHASADTDEQEDILRGQIQALRLSGLHDEVAVALDRLSLLGQTSTSPRLTCDAAALKAQHWFGRHRFDLARQLAEAHLPVARRLDDPLVAARLLWVLSMVARQTGSFNESLSVSEACLDRLAVLDTPASAELRVQCLINVGNTYGQTGRLSRAISAFERAGEQSERAGFVSSRIICTMNSGICHALQAQYWQALEFFQRARRDAVRLGWAETRDILAVNQAEVECHLARFECAVRRAGTLIEQGDVAAHVISAARMVLADALLELGDTSQAADVLHRVRQDGQDGARIALLEAKMHASFGGSEASGKALTLLETAASIGAPHEAAQAHARRALILLELGQTQPAVDAIVQSTSAFDAGPPEIREGAVEISWARYRVFSHCGDGDKAQEALRDGAGYLKCLVSGLEVSDRESILKREVYAGLVDASVRQLGETYEHFGYRPRQLEVVADSMERFTSGQSWHSAMEAMLTDVLSVCGGRCAAVAKCSGESIHWQVGRSSGGGPFEPDPIITEWVSGLRRQETPGFTASAESVDQTAWPLFVRGKPVGVLVVLGRNTLALGADAALALRTLVASAALMMHVRQLTVDLESLQQLADDELTRTKRRLHEETNRRQRAERAVVAERQAIQLAHSYDQIIHRSHAMAVLLSQLDKLVDRKATVLVVGESGTGKELVARALHHHGVRSKGPFVALNCGAIPENLIESELFGHVKGAFTGAHRDRMGHFELASQGTLFLDEVGELAASLQVRLLRVLETGTVTKVGGSKEVSVDTRIVAATNRDLAEEVAAGRFRQDLFYRLNVVMLKIPPLRDRPEDIEPLLEHFIQIIAAERGEKPIRLSPRLIQRLLSHSWPGNVRELRNILEYATLFADNGEVTGDLSLPF